MATYSDPFDINPDLWIIYGRAAREMLRKDNPPNAERVSAVLLKEPAILLQAIEQLETLTTKLMRLAKEGIEQ